MLLALVGAYSEFRNPPGGDPASLLYAAGRILDGARLYTDLIDLNPPFTFLFHLPVVAASRLLHLDVISCFRVFVCGLVVLSGAALYLVLRHSEADAGTRHALAASFLMGSLGLVIGFFGEREHLQLVLMFPYLAIASLRFTGDIPPRRLAILAGCLAGVGLAIKVTAGLVPVLIAGLLWIARRRRSDESLVALIMLAIATGVGLLWAPGYLAEVNQFGAFYRGFSGASVANLLGRAPMVWPLVVAPLLLLAGWRVMRFRGGVAVWFVAGMGFVVSVLVQGKGFPYHYFPAIGCAATATVLTLASGAMHTGRADAWRRVLAGAALLIMPAPALLVAGQRLSATQRVVDTFSEDSFEMLRDAPPGTRVAVQSSRLADAFPLGNVRHLRLTGRYPHLWFLYPYDSSAGAQPERIVPYADSRLLPVERQLRRGTGEDLARDQPELLLVRDPGASRVVLRYLCDDTLYRRAARNYQLVRQDSIMQLFRRDTTMHSEGACGSL
jgi:hypothetical protein